MSKDVLQILKSSVTAVIKIFLSLKKLNSPHYNSFSQ